MAPNGTLGGRTGTVSTVVGAAALSLSALVLLGTAAAELTTQADDAAGRRLGTGSTDEIVTDERVASEIVTDEIVTPAGLERHAREVTVRLQGRDCEGFSSGTGFLVGGRRLVTSRHVVEASLGVGATTADGVGLIAAVATLSVDADLAVLAADSDGRPAELGTARPEAGSVVVAAGFPGGGPLALAPGEVAQYVDGDLFDVNGDVMMFTAVVGPGYSGGPLFDRAGRVVGVVVGVETHTGLGLALPVERLGTLLDGSSGIAPPVPCPP